MKHSASLVSILLIAIVLFSYRCYYSDISRHQKDLVITKWDAFGYYLYLPATVIYHDYKKLGWAATIDKTYNVTGGDGMPVQHLDNGNRVCKYLGGVAVLQAPWFFAAHLIAQLCGCPADGFSQVYQYALAFGVIIYCLLALLLLRHTLLRYFVDSIVAITLLLLCLATNFIQYAAVDNGLSHSWIFPLYVVLLFATIKWHERPKAVIALLIGYIIGLATICRPTEAIALFIPLLWNLHNKEASRVKWALVKANKLHFAFAVLGGLLGILPQLLYWKAVTGSFVYDVGSKWVFLNPWWRVLVGWEKGWFIYTPVTILFVIGLFMMKRFPFQKAALVFCLLNIWIIISWDEWQYGASYSTRALVQSYPVFALPLAAFISRLQMQRWKYVLYAAGVYLIAVNLFQIVQYNSGIIHYNDMSRRYYGHVYLNPSPAPLDMSLLDGAEWLDDESAYRQQALNLINTPTPVQFSANGSQAIVDTPLALFRLKGDGWIRINARIRTEKRWKSSLAAELRVGDSVKRTSVRLLNPVGIKTDAYAFYMEVPAYFRESKLKILLSSEYHFEGTVSELKLTTFQH